MLSSLSLSPMAFPVLFNLIFMAVVILVSETHPASCRYTSIFSFGDSLTDTGNYLYIDSSANIGHYPYGETFFHNATGRYSDGRVVVDFIAEALGLPFLPPYLAYSDGQDLRHGANFAVGGATAINPDSFKEGNSTEGVIANVSLGYQIEWFTQLLPSLCDSPSACRDFLRGSLFLVGEMGGNDYYHLFQYGWNLEEIRTIVPKVVNTIASAVHTLIEHGAMTLVVPGCLPLGCFPAILTIEASSNKEDYDTTGCLKKWNELLQYHNFLLKIDVDRIQELHPHATIIYADYYDATIRFCRSPDQFGFSKEGGLSACCGAGGPYNYNASVLCGTQEARVCSDPSQYWNWDGSHFTEGGNRLIADVVINGLCASSPISNPCMFGSTSAY